MGLKDRFKKVLGSAKKEEELKQEGSDDIVRRQPVEFKPKLTSGNVLFVCSNNNFVSPIAQTLFNKKVKSKKAYSAGASSVAASGTPLPAKTLEICRDNAIDLSYFAVSLLEDYELGIGVLILTSTVYYRDLLRQRYSDFDVFTINEYAGFSNLDIEEPYGIDSSLWEGRFDDVSRAIDKIVEIHFADADIAGEEPIDENERNFSYLDRLIRSGACEIVLDSDIVLGDGEVEDYLDGIRVDADNIVIDGAGHKIDAMGKARIFAVYGSNVSFKNITFSNAFDSKYFLGGAAIRNHSKDACCMDCRFIYNMSSGRGGAICNEEESSLSIYHCLFSENGAEHSGGAISNEQGGVLNVHKSDFFDNHVENGSGGAIFNSAALNIDNSTFKNNRASKEGYGYDDGGGAIFNQSSVLNISDSRLEGNYSAQYGGAILNMQSASVSMENVTFCRNDAVKQGNTIFNKGELRIEGCKFHKNASISHVMGNLKIFKSVFKGNSSPCLISNQDQAAIDNTVFEGNAAGTIVENSKNLSIYSVEFKNNNLEKSAIVNSGPHCSLDKAEFAGNSPRNVLNDGSLTIKDITLSDEKSILNNDEIILKGELDERTIDNHGIVKRPGIPQKRGHDFSCLNDIIQSSKGNLIALDHDYSIEEYETEFFEGGIELEGDHLTIDGKNHVIDAKSLSRIFIVTSGNVTLKNIVFKNGCSFKNHDNPINGDGGAVRNNYAGNLKLINCRFLENAGEVNGAAVSNNGKLLVEDCIFKNNNSESYGGSIYNSGKIDIVKGEFDSNHANKGGVIYNLCEISVNDSTFSNNSAGSYGGAIFNQEGDLKIFNSCFKHNSIVAKHALISGGAIYNDGELLVEDTSFYGNELYEGSGPAIKTERGRTIENNCTFKDNRVLDKDDDY